MAVNIDSTLSSYAQAAGVSVSDLTGKDGKKALAAADKVLQNVANNPSAEANKNTVEDALLLDAQTYNEAHKGDTFTNFQSHVASTTGNNSDVNNDLSDLASSNEISGTSTIGAFAAALANTFVPSKTSTSASTGSAGAAGASTPGGNMTTMSTKNKGDADGHDYQTTSVSAGSYEISYRQWNDHDNKLTVTDADGNSVSLPSGMANGGPGVFSLPNGGPTISVGSGGKNASIAVSYQGETQETQYHGAGQKGGSTTSSWTGDIGGSTASGASASASSGSGSGATNSLGQQLVDPQWVLSAESSLAKAYGVSADDIASGANAYWTQEATGSTSSPNFGNNAAAQKGWEIGQEFAENYINQGNAKPSTITLGSTPSGMSPISGGPATVSVGSSSNGASGSSGASSLPALNTSSQNTDYSAVWIGTALNTLSTAWGNDAGASLLQGAEDAWTQQYNPSGFTPPNFANASPTESAAYMAGRAFAEAYHAGQDPSTSANSGPGDAALNPFEPTGSTGA